MMTSLLELRIRACIARREWYTAAANYEAQQGGWRTDWANVQAVNDAELDALLRQANGEGNEDEAAANTG